MGRRSINTTKSGKYMNPTDQARKEARKRELKKNKKQRMMVRQAVLKGKDPARIIDDMEIIDKMEYNPLEPPKLNEKVLKDKRKKLKETFDRVLGMYEKEDPEYSMDLRKQYNEYEKRRVELQLYYEQVMNAQRVQLDNIPLPDAPTDQAVSTLMLPGDIPLPTIPDTPNIKSILKSNKQEGSLMQNISLPPPQVQLTKAQLARKRKPPGPPPGPPPELTDSDDEEYDPENVTDDVDLDSIQMPGEPPAKSRKIRFEDDEDHDPEEPEKDSRTKYKSLARILSGHEIPLPPGVEEEEFEVTKNSKKLEVDEDSPVDDDSTDEDDDDDNDKKRKEDKNNKNTKNDGAEATKEKGTSDKKKDESTAKSGEPITVPPGPPPGLPPGPPPGLPPMMFRPPPLRGGPPGVLPIRLPPGPPPGRPPGRPPGLPPGPPPGLPPNLRPPPMRPHGPPGMMPPRMMRPPGALPGLLPPGIPPMLGAGLGPMNPNVLSAPPSIMKPPQRLGPGGGASEEEKATGEDKKKTTSTIVAKPKIKKLGDVTKFMPTALKVRREMKDAKGKIIRQQPMEDGRAAAMPMPSVAPKTKDDAYDAFMKEMENFF